MQVSGPTSKLRTELRRTWLIWSCVPLAGLVLVLLAASAVYASQPELSIKRAEDSFYTFLAICALVFLFTFTVDGYWTNPKRLAEKISRADDSGLPQSAAAEARANLASRAVLGSASALGFLGHAIAIAAVLCLAGGAGTMYAFLLLSVAVSYQLFLFSRHPYYEKVVEAALQGELDLEEQETSAKDEDANRRK